MSQYYSQQPGYYPPPNPEGGYYDETYEEYEVADEGEPRGDSWLTRLGIFAAGSCLTFVLMAGCGVVGAGLWILDPGSSLLTPTYPNSDIGLTAESPAGFTEEVVNDSGMRLSVVEVNRNADSNTIAPQEGAEIVVVTVELENLSPDPLAFDDERHFNLLNRADGFYEPTPGAIDGALGFGELRSAEGTQGRLVFQILADEPYLMLEWMGADSTPRYIELQ